MTAGLRWDDAQLAAFQRKRKAAPAPGSVKSLRLTLPYPPTVNTSGASAFRGGKKSDEYNAFMAAVARVVVDAGSPRIDGRLSVEIHIVPPDKRARDIDNLCKGTLDALAKAGVYENDSQIDELIVRRMPCFIAGEGGMTVNITRLVTV